MGRVQLTVGKTKTFTVKGLLRRAGISEQLATLMALISRNGDLSSALTVSLSLAALATGLLLGRKDLDLAGVAAAEGLEPRGLEHSKSLGDEHVERGGSQVHLIRTSNV